MKLVLVPGKCSGHARCAAVAPDLFKLDEDGYLDLRDAVRVTPDQEAFARRGARACPERAIAVVDEAGSQA